MKRRVRTLCLLALVACKSSPGIPESHRASDVRCPLGSPVSTNPCDATADCPAAQGVSCLAYDDAGLARYCNDDACHVDRDCGDGGVCLCGSASSSATLATPNVCLSAGNCRLDSDCSPVHYCSPSSVGCGTTFAYYCHTAHDDCSNDTDCRQDQLCLYAPSAGKWSCFTAGTCNG